MMCSSDKDLFFCKISFKPLATGFFWGKNGAFSPTLYRFRSFSRALLPQKAFSRTKLTYFALTMSRRNASFENSRGGMLFWVRENPFPIAASGINDSCVVQKVTFQGPAFFRRDIRTFSGSAAHGAFERRADFVADVGILKRIARAVPDHAPWFNGGSIVQFAQKFEKRCKG